jgi:hypothetical protein
MLGVDWGLSGTPDLKVFESKSVVFIALSSHTSPGRYPRTLPFPAAFQQGILGQAGHFP